MNKDVTLLIVDDEPDLRDIVADSFTNAGYHVLTASNGSEAFDVVKHNKVDVIVSDVRMPGGDGIDLLCKLKEINPDSPNVILATGFSDLSLQEAYDKGASSMIAKPFERKALLAAIESASVSPEESWRSSSNQPSPTMTIHLESASHNVSFGRGGMFVGLSEKFPAEGTCVKFKIGDLGGLGVV